MRATNFDSWRLLKISVILSIFLTIATPALAQSGHGGSGHGRSGYGGSDGSRHHSGDSGRHHSGYNDSRGHESTRYGAFGYGRGHDNGFGVSFGYGGGYGRYSYGGRDAYGDGGRHGYGDRRRHSYGYGDSRHHRYGYGYGDGGRYGYGGRFSYDHLRYNHRDYSRRYLDHYGATSYLNDFGWGRADLFLVPESISVDPQEPYYEGLYTAEDFATLPYIWVGDLRVKNLAYKGPAGASEPGDAVERGFVDEGSAAYQVEPYDFRPQPALVRMSIHPANASVYLDGEFMGLASDLTDVVLLEPGEHRLEAVHPGMTSRELTFTAESGEEVAVDARLEKAAQ